MGIYSDVAIMVKADALKRLPANVLEQLEQFDDQQVTPDGTIFAADMIKWGYTWCEPIQAALRVLGSENYRIVTACHDYPDANDDEGDWVDNPWNAYKSVSVSVKWRPAVYEWVETTPNTATTDQ